VNRLRTLALVVFIALAVTLPGLAAADIPSPGRVPTPRPTPQPASKPAPPATAPVRPTSPADPGAAAIPPATIAATVGVVALLVGGSAVALVAVRRRSAHDLEGPRE